MPKEDTVAVGDPLINRYCYYVRRQLKRYPNDAMTLAWVEQVEARLKRMGLSGLDFQADKFHKKLRCRKRADRSDYGFNEGVSMSIEEFDIVRRKEHFAKRPRGSGPRIRKRSKPIKGLKRGQTLPAPDRQLESDAEAVLSGEEGMEEEDEEARAATWVSKKSSARIQTKNKPKPAATAQPPAPTPPQSKPPAAASAKATTTTAASAATKPAGSASGGLKRKSKAASRAKTVSTSAANLTEAAKKDVVVPAEAPTAQPSPRATRASKRLKATAPAVDSSALPPPDGTQANSTLTPSQSTPVNQTAPPPSKAAPKKGRPPRLQLTDPDASEPVPAPEVQNKSTSKRATKKTVKKTAPRSSRAKQSKSLPSEPDTGDGTANAVQLEDTLARALQVRDADKTPAQRKSEAAAAARYAQLYGGLGSVVALKAYCMDMERKYASDALQRKPEYVLRKMALRTVVTGQPISVSGKSLPSSGSPPSQDADTEEAGTGAPEDMDVSDGEVSDSGSSVSDIPIPKLWDSPTKDRYDIGPEECNKVKPHSGEVVRFLQLSFGCSSLIGMVGRQKRGRGCFPVHRR